ncbi:hypothetical protein Pla163_37810 [Planctomycetes bacterium Pla163]|uniref:Cysteine ligase BshC n=1 Tax=Rohdeia mirabilis TaxID=2528008 RepID=A0A518D575_9BACT|nr:hypothetical protein Pla163_37810 [Planctomycetes bacterium Pla163]
MPQARHLAGDVLGLSPLARHVFAERPWPRVLGGAGGVPVPARLAEFEVPEPRFDPALLERGELVERLRAHVDPHHPDPSHLHPAIDASIAKLGDPRGLCVVATARPAFLGGPLSNLYAALHAAALAKALERHLERPVAPVLWIRSDAHDQANARDAWLLNQHLDLTRTGLPSMGSGRRRIGAIELGDSTHRLAALASQLRHVLPETAHRDPSIALFMPRAGETLGAAQRRAFAALVGGLGVVCVEPAALRPTLSRALARLVAVGGAGQPSAVRLEPFMDVFDLRSASSSSEAILERVELDPYHPVAAYRSDEGQQRALHLVDDQFLFAGEEGRRSASELAAEIVAAPERFTPGPLLEPLARDLVLPVVATVASEWDDLRAACLAVEWRRAVDAPRPALVPRQRVTLVSALARESLTKRGVALEDVLRARGRFAQEAEASADRPAVLERLREMARRQAEELKALRPELAEVEKGLAHRLRRAADDNRAAIDAITARAERVAANRTGKTRRHERRLENTLFPKERPQEEVLTTLQYTSAFGTGWIDDLAEAVDPLASEHLVLELQ